MAVLLKAIALLLLVLATIIVEAVRVNQSPREEKKGTRDIVRKGQTLRKNAFLDRIEQENKRILGEQRLKLQEIYMKNRALVINTESKKCNPQKRYAQEPNYYLGAFVFPDNDRPTYSGFDLKTHIDCHFSGEVSTKLGEQMRFSRSTTPIVERRDGKDYVLCLSDAFANYQGKVSVSMRWNMENEEMSRDVSSERALSGHLDYAFIYYEKLSGRVRSGHRVELPISKFLASENEVPNPSIRRVVFFHGEDRESIMGRFNQILRSFEARKRQTAGNLQMMAAFEIPPTDRLSSLTPICEFRCICQDSSCPSDKVVSSAFLLDSERPFEYMACATTTLLDCSGNSLPGKIVAVLSYTTQLTLFGTSTVVQKTAALDFVVKRKIGTNGPWEGGSPFTLNRSLRSIRVGRQSEDRNLEFKLFGGASPATMRLRREAFLSKAPSTSQPSKLRIGAFNVELSIADFLGFLKKWKINFDSNRKVLDTSPGAILADIVGHSFDILAVLESGFPSKDKNGMEQRPDPLMKSPNRENVIPLEAGTESRQRNPSMSSVLREFHEALVARDTEAENLKRVLPRKSARKSLGVSYSTNSRVDGVMMFWNPDAFNDPICLLFNQATFVFTYPPYICLWENAKNGQFLITIAVHITYPDSKSKSTTTRPNEQCDVDDEEDGTVENSVQRAQQEICRGLPAAAEFAVRMFCPQGDLEFCPPIIAMGDFNIDAFSNPDRFHHTGYNGPSNIQGRGCLSQEGNILEWEGPDSGSLILDPRVEFYNQMNLDHDTSIYFMNTLVNNFRQIEKYLTVGETNPERLKAIRRALEALSKDSTKKSYKHDRFFSYRKKHRSDPPDVADVIPKVGDVLPVLGGKNTESTNFKPALKETRVAWEYLKREDDDFLLTSQDTCLLEETNCNEKFTEKGWKDLVSDHFPIVLDINL